MPAIGGYSVTVFDGRLLRARQMVGAIEPDPGVDGHTVVRGAWRAEPAVVRTAVEVTGIASARRLVELYRAQHGLVVTVIDGLGEAWLDVTVLGVVATYSATVFTNRYRVEALWRLLPPSTRPAA